ncbi:MAG: leucine--tRNA ligase, partial [Dehalococcoidia bacterium]|nr:leucine--tRNA ligase [Dehalococcoidia bacterium]
VLAPEHELVLQLTTPERRSEVEAYVEQAKRQSEIERTAAEREKSGIFTGAYATNPLNGEQVPIWVADYVLATYGTGIVMGVPAHDQRDFEFAQEFGLDIKVVIAPPGWNGEPLTHAYIGPGEMVNSGSFDGTFTRADWPKMPTAEQAILAGEWGFTVEAVDGRIAGQEQDGIEAISDAIEARGWGQRAVNYRMRDWLISRQRYWGSPIPIIHCPDCGEVPVAEENLPVLLPELDDIAPGGDGQSPLVRATDWVNVTCPQCGTASRRETDTMGGFACSSWYQLRFASPDHHEGPFDPGRAKYWMPVDLYVGGAEHAVMHLLYARFWYKVMRDANLGVPGNEPFYKLLNQGQVHASDGRRMSKSRGNVITPDEMVERYGADSLRLYELFMAPFEQDVDWNEQRINGQRRFLRRIWDLILQTASPSANGDGTAADSGPDDLELARQLHKTTRRVTEDIQAFKFNTMVAALMEFANDLGERHRAGTWHTRTWDEAIRSLLVLLAPSAPHIAEELWQRTGRLGSVHQQVWPTWDEELVRDELVTVVVQIDGKVRDRLELPADAPEEDVRAAARESERAQRWVADWDAVQWRYIPGRIVSLSTKSRS